MSRTDGLITRIRDHGVALAIGVLIGVVGHIAWLRADDLTAGNDRLAYVDVIDEIHPIGASPQAMAERLDRLTDRSWELASLFSGIAKGPESLPARADALASDLSLPPADGFRLQGLMTNVRKPESRADAGTLAVIRFSGLDQARRWLHEDNQIFLDDAADGRRETFWAGELVIYYVPPDTGADLSAQVREWGQQVSDCPGSAGDCAASAD